MSRPIRRILLGSLMLVALALTPAVASALTATLTIPNLCTNPVEVTLFSIEAMNNLVIGSGGILTGKASFQPLVLSKAPDDCTPLLFKAVFLGQLFPTATLQVGTRNTPDLFTIQFTNVVISNLKNEFAKNGPGESNDVLMENVTLNAGSLTFTGGGVTVTCSQITNKC